MEYQSIGGLYHGKVVFEQMGGTYHQEGDYFLPNLAVPESVPVGVWGQRRRRYLREHRKALYNTLLLSGKLNSHLAGINQQANDMFSQLAKRCGLYSGFGGKPTALCTGHAIPRR